MDFFGIFTENFVLFWDQISRDYDLMINEQRERERERERELKSRERFASWLLLIERKVSQSGTEDMTFSYIKCNNWGVGPRQIPSRCFTLTP